MNSQTAKLDVEEIVQAVLRRLKGEGAPIRGDDVLVDDVQGDGRGVEIVDRVVSLETAKSVASSARVVLPADAVITPAARDYFQENGVAWSRRGQSGEMIPTNGKSNSEIDILQFACQKAVDVTALGDSLRRQGVSLREGARTASTNELTDMMSRLATIVETARAVCLTGKPSLVLCAANRQPMIRAAAARCTCCVKDAAASLGANVLVVNPKGKSRHQLCSILREFAGCTIDCPAALKKSLVLRNKK